MSVPGSLVEVGRLVRGITKSGSTMSCAGTSVNGECTGGTVTNNAGSAEERCDRDVPRLCLDGDILLETGEGDRERGIEEMLDRGVCGPA